MIRGCQRRIYHVKNPQSEIFDEAYFVLRRGYVSRGELSARDGELGAEAARITALTDRGTPPRRTRRDRIVSFLAGAAAAGGAVGVAALLTLR